MKIIHIACDNINPNHNLNLSTRWSIIIYDPVHQVSPPVQAVYIFSWQVHREEIIPTSICYYGNSSCSMIDCHNHDNKNITFLLRQQRLPWQPKLPWQLVLSDLCSLIYRQINIFLNIVHHFIKFHMLDIWLGNLNINCVPHV